MAGDARALSVASRLLEELRGDERLEDEVLTFIAERIALKPGLRQILLSALLREVATKEDVGKLRDEMKELRSYVDDRISKLEARLSTLEQRVARIEGQLSLFVKLFVAFNVPILIGIIGILLRMWAP